MAVFGVGLNVDCTLKKNARGYVHYCLIGGPPLKGYIPLIFQCLQRNTIFKIISTLTDRITTGRENKIPEQQFGFRKDRSTYKYLS